MKTQLLQGWHPDAVWAFAIPCGIFALGFIEFLVFMGIDCYRECKAIDARAAARRRG